MIVIFISKKISRKRWLMKLMDTYKKKDLFSANCYSCNKNKYLSFIKKIQYTNGKKYIQYHKIYFIRISALY